MRPTRLSLACLSPCRRYKQKTSYEPARLLFQGADSLFVVTKAIEAANSTEPDAMIKALENLKWSGLPPHGFHTASGSSNLVIANGAQIKSDRAPQQDVHAELTARKYSKHHVIIDKAIVD
jgi:hypothetical protein